MMRLPLPVLELLLAALTEPEPPARPRRYLVCVKCETQGHTVAPDALFEQWTCPACLSASDRTDRDWRGVGAGQ
jgi:hypothetical protein